MDRIPEGYEPILNIKDTEKAIERMRDFFQDIFADNLKLHRVSAPLFVDLSSGLNDNLSGSERAVSFNVSALDKDCEIVHSLAKWKRMALGKYGYDCGEGIYTNMNALRRDESNLDNLHSVYVDQWDWEKIITAKDRTRDYLEKTVKLIYKSIYQTAKYVESLFPEIKSFLPERITFVTSQEMETELPDMCGQERENVFAKRHGAIFVIGIGEKLLSGSPHDLRAPDYDDWSMNGDILIWYPVLNRAVELSSMGIRVDKKALKEQLAKASIKQYTRYHQAILNNQYPLTIGGGIGQSRLCMTLLHKAHIGEVHCSIWDEETLLECSQKGIKFL